MLRSSTKITNQAHTYSYDTPLVRARDNLGDALDRITPHEPVAS